MATLALIIGVDHSKEAATDTGTLTATVGTPNGLAKAKGGSVRQDRPQHGPKRETRKAAN